MKFSVKQITSIPQSPGIYKFYSGNSRILYIGKAKNLKKRIRNYFAKNIKEERIKQMVKSVKIIEIIPVISEFEALLLEARLIKKYLPKYNVIWKDDKHYIYLKITKEKFPKILFARKDNGGGEYFGPFPSAFIVRELLKMLRKIFPFCTQNRSSKRACFYSHIGLCRPCPSEIAKNHGQKYYDLYKQYQDNIKDIRSILQGKITKVSKILYKKMLMASREADYETAAFFRDKRESLDYLLNQYTPIGKYIENPHYLEIIFKNEKNELLKYLHPYFPDLHSIKSIECYDISNLSGKSASGSMVTFINNKPEKSLYRRFKIRLFQKPNDFGMLQEIFRRRLSHNDWKLPDIILIDGGKPQLQAVLKILNTFKIDIPVIGLAKLYEEIVIPQNKTFIKLKLPYKSGALHLLQRIRDEAHRFAHDYHTLIRLKQLYN